MAARRRRDSADAAGAGAGALRGSRPRLPRAWLAVPPHPQGVRPLGNLLWAPASAHRVRSEGLGALARLSDELLLEAVLAQLPARALACVAQASRACYAFAVHDDLWRAHVLARDGGAFQFRGTWHRTYFAARVSAHIPSGLHSDVLYRPWQCAAVAARDDEDGRTNGVGARPCWWDDDGNVDRRANLSVTAFVREYEEANRPVVLTDVVPQWPAFQRWRDRAYLLAHAGDAQWEVGPVHMRLADYFAYSDATRDEAPLYLFDPRFATRSPALADDYAVPPHFGEDLFALLGAAARPHHRWLIVGPARSGSTFHIDPNGTSAWNAVVTGAKRWIMFPPGTVPPGVHPSADGADVTSPVSLAEWLLSFYDDARAHDPPPVEFTARAGDLVFVPHGWWHAVLNLEDSIAITHNYVSRRNLLHVLAFLRARPEQVSGLGADDDDDECNPSPPRGRYGGSGGGGSGGQDLYRRFRTAFEAAYPGELEQLEAAAAATARAPTTPFWDHVRSDPAAATSFTFGFAHHEHDNGGKGSSSSDGDAEEER
jgi:hypothetical protein